MVSELKVERGGYSNPLADIMGNYLPIIHGTLWKQVATSMVLSKSHDSIPGVGLFVLLTFGAKDLTKQIIIMLFWSV